MLLLALSFLYYFNYAIWDIVIPGIFSLKWPYWPKSEVKQIFYLLTYSKTRQARAMTSPANGGIPSRVGICLLAMAIYYSGCNTHG